MLGLLKLLAPRRRRSGRQRPMPNFQKRVPTMFSMLVRGSLGEVKHVGRHHPNLRTNAGVDWQALLMGDYRFDSGLSTGTSATTLTDTGKAWATNQWVGHLVVAFATSPPPIIVGIVQSNTATVLTVTTWLDLNTAWIGSGTPSATNEYVIMPGGLPIGGIALTADATAPAAGDTTLTSEITANGLSRAQPTSYTHTTATNSLSLSKTYTCTGGATTVSKQAVFTVTGTTAGVRNVATMPFESLEPDPPTLVSGDTLAQTVTITI